MKERKNLMIPLTIIFLILIFALTVQSQQKPGTGQVTQKAAQPQPMMKAPTIDPIMLRRLQGNVPRTMLISSLMGNQATRGVIQNLAKSAKIQASELSIKTLDGNPVSPAPQGQLIDQLNWNAGIKFSMIKNRPTFFYPPLNSMMSLGRIGVHGADLYSEFMSYYINNDVFIGKNIYLELHLPLTPATYMIAVQFSSLLPIEITVSDRSGVKKIQNVVPLSSGDGYVGLTQIAPSVYREGLGLCAIDVKSSFLGSATFFSGFTISRL